MNIQGKNHPVQIEIKRLCVSQTFTAEFKEDTEALQTLSTIVPGIVAIVCTISQNGRVISRGHSISTFSVTNKYLTRTIYSAIQGSFTSACYGASKIFESLLTPNTEGQEEKMSEERHLNEKYQNQKYSAVVVAPNIPKTPKSTEVVKSDEMTSKQKILLTDLVNQKVSSRECRERYYSQIEACNKFDASEMISSFMMCSQR